MNINELSKILLVHSGGIGDLILSTPTIRALREVLPTTAIHFLCSPKSVEVLDRNPGIDKIITLDTVAVKKTPRVDNLLVFGGIISLLRKLRREHYDLLIILQPQLSLWAATRMATFCFLLNTKERIGRNTEGRGFFLTRKFYESASSQEHEVLRMLKLTELIGVKVDKVEPEIRISDSDRFKAQKLLDSKNDIKNNLMICFAPGFGKSSRAWYPERWAQLGDRLSRELKAKIVIIGGEREVNLVSNITFLMCTQALILVGQTSLMETAAILKRCDLLVTNDSGPMHLACAVGCKIVALFGPGDYNRIRPYAPEKNWRVVRKMVPCSPCYKQACGDHKCMRSITVDDVIFAIKELLNQ